MNNITSPYKIKNALKTYAPEFYSFFRTLYSTGSLTDVIFLRQDNSSEPMVLTSHSKSAPRDYYKWVKENDHYFPEFVKEINIKLSDLVIVGDPL